MNATKKVRSEMIADCGVIGGAQIGYNWQFSPVLVVGLEADIQSAVARTACGTKANWLPCFWRQDLVIGGPGVRRRTLSLVKSGTVPQRSHHDRTASAEVTLQNPTIRYAHVVASQQRICACVTPRVHNSACLCYIVPNDLKAMMIEHALDVTAGPGKIIIDAEFPLYVEADQIYNLACPASPIHYQHDPVQTTKTSVHGAINMLGLAVTPAGSRNLRYFWPCVRPAARHTQPLWPGTAQHWACRPL
jgi:hypothetical protein